LILKVGSLVTWNHRGGKATGKIIKIARQGKLKIPKSSLTLTATQAEPAALIRVIKGGEFTSTVVGHKLKSLKSARGL
jgi:hypothetical protein